MKEYQFSSKDFELLKELLKVTKNIKLVYNELYNLEINNKKDTKEYQNLLKTLKYHLNKEEEYYNLISNSIESLYSFMDYLFPNGCIEFEEEIELLKEDNESDILRMRLSNQINKLINNYSFSNNLDDYKEELSYGIDYDKEYKKGILIENTIKEDIYNSILVMINKYINNEKYSFAVNKLIKFKYNYSFMYKRVENSMINSNFEINDNLYILSILFTEFQGKNINTTYDTLISYVKSLYEIQVRELIYLIKDENNKDKKNEQLVLEIIILRAICLFMSKTEVNDFKNTINLQLLLSMLDNSMVTDIINEMFSEREKDLEIPKVLSLSLKPLK